MKQQRFKKLRLETCEPRRLLAATVTAVGELACTDHGMTGFGDSASTSSAMENLRSLTSGMLNFESAQGRLPSHAIYSADGMPLLSWRVSVLPYLGYGELYDRFHLDEPWDSPHNLQLLKPMPLEFRGARVPTGPLSGTRPLSPVETAYQVVVGPGTVFPENEVGLRMSAIRDGVSNTVLVIETDATNAVPWTKPQDIVFDPNHPLDGLGDAATVGFNAALATAEPIAVPLTVDPELWTNLLLRDDGQFVDLNQIAPPLGAEASLAALSVAVLNHEAVTQRLPPPALYAADGEPLLSWRVRILPFIDQRNLFEQFHLDEPWDSPHNLSLLPMMPRVFAHEGVPLGFTNYLVFVGEDTAFPVPENPSSNRGLSLGDISDGLSNTILAAQADWSFAVEWSRPQDIAYDPLNPLHGVGHIGTEEFHVGFADGHVEAIPNAVPAATFHHLVTRNDGVLAESLPWQRGAVGGGAFFASFAAPDTGIPVSHPSSTERSPALTSRRDSRTGRELTSPPVVELVFERFEELELELMGG